MAVVAKPRASLALNVLENPELPGHLLPLAGYTFEEATFKAGLLVLPPNSIKKIELTTLHEVFYVHDAEEKSLEFTLRTSSFCLSKGCVFTAPAGNLYRLRNMSTTTPIVLQFAVVKKD